MKKRLIIIGINVVVVVGVVSMFWATNYGLKDSLEQEKYRHRQSIVTLSNSIQDYDDYVTQLEKTIEEWRKEYGINEPLSER